MFRQTFPAGVSWWFIGSRVVGSTPWAMTTLPCGAAEAATGNAATSAAARAMRVKVMEISS